MLWFAGHQKAPPAGGALRRSTKGGDAFVDASIRVSLPPCDPLSCRPQYESDKSCPPSPQPNAIVFSRAKRRGAVAAGNVAAHAPSGATDPSVASQPSAGHSGGSQLSTASPEAASWASYAAPSNAGMPTAPRAGRSTASSAAGGATAMPVTWSSNHSKRPGIATAGVDHEPTRARLDPRYRVHSLHKEGSMLPETSPLKTMPSTHRSTGIVFKRKPPSARLRRADELSEKEVRQIRWASVSGDTPEMNRAPLPYPASIGGRDSALGSVQPRHLTQNAPSERGALLLAVGS